MIKQLTPQNLCSHLNASDNWLADELNIISCATFAYSKVPG